MPSVIEIAKSLEYPVKIFEHHFPELCAAILEKRLLRLDINDLRMKLEAILASEEEPISVSEVARRLGYSSRTIFNRFPVLYSAISGRYQNFRQQRKKERVEKLCQAVQQATIVIHERGEHPTSTRVGSMIGSSIHFKIPEVRLAWRKKMEELGYEG